MGLCEERVDYFYISIKWEEDPDIWHLGENISHPECCCAQLGSNGGWGPWWHKGIEGNLKCRERRVGKNDYEALVTMVQVGTDKDLLKAMAVGVTREVRMPNISIVKSVGLVTPGQRSMVEIPPRFLILSNWVNNDAVISFKIKGEGLVGKTMISSWTLGDTQNTAGNKHICSILELSCKHEWEFPECIEKREGKKLSKEAWWPGTWKSWVERSPKETNRKEEFYIINTKEEE